MSLTEDKPLLVSSKEDGNKKKTTTILSKDCVPWIKCRVVITIMTFLGLVNVYALRVNLSMAIIVMVNNSDTTDNDNPLPFNPNSTVSKTKVYNWSQSEQGWVLSAFFCGYIVTQIPGGWLAHKFGAKYVYGIGIVMTAILTLLTPIAADISVWALVAVRALEGLFEGVTFPATHALFGAWAPPAERSRMVAIAYSGQFVGSVISFPLSAVLCVYGFDGGWPSVFYIFGGVGIVWFIFWLLLGYSSPATHPRISYAERKYIETSIAESKSLHQDDKHLPTPWLAILTSPAVWGIIVAHFCGNYGFYVLLTTMPTYFSQALGFKLGSDLLMNGLFSAIPFVIEALVVFIAGPLADFLRAKYFSTTVTRKLFTCSSLVASAVFLLLTGYLGTSKPVAITLISLGVGLGGFSLAGHCINHIDIAPKYSGILMGITNSAGTLPGIIGPVIAKSIAHSHNAPRSVYIEEWREVFIIAAEVYLFGAAIYAILGDGKKQWWADGDRRKLKHQINLPSHHTDHSDDSITSSIQIIR